ncbi:MAG TPA: response regulator [bacterium]|nr:response regulator [bacterium]
MGKTTRILIIEDDEDMIEAMKWALSPIGCEIEAAAHPETGLERAREMTPDLIILDVMFGPDEKTEGFDYAIRIRQDPCLASVPILMTTAVNTEYPGFGFSDKTDGEFLPVDDFIDKPAPPEILLEKVKRLLDRKTSKWSGWPDQSH